MDCCSLEGRTLKTSEVVEFLSEFVIVRLEPMDWDEDKAFGAKFGVTEFPALLMLDSTGERKLGTIGDESPEDVAKALRTALGR